MRLFQPWKWTIVATFQNSAFTQPIHSKAIVLSYWESEHLTKTDVAIIGGGIVGLSTAASILERYPELSVTLFERSLLPYGASTRNAGFACFGSLTEILSDIAVMGETQTRELLFNRWLGLQITRKRLGDEAIGFDPAGGYELVDHKTFEDSDVQAINELVSDFIPNYITDVSDLKASLGISGSGCLYAMRDEGQVNTGKLVQSLSDYVSRNGARVLTGAEVAGIESIGGEGYEVNVNDGFRGNLSFKAKRVVVCTNAFTSALIPDLDIQPGRGQVLLTKSIGGLKFRGNLHIDEGFYYLRNVGDKLLIGGGRNLDFDTENTLEDALNDSIQNALERKLNDIFGLELHSETAQRWSGVMAFGKDKWPIVKELHPGFYLGVKMSGMGIALAGYIGEEIADLLE